MNADSDYRIAPPAICTTCAEVAGRLTKTVYGIAVGEGSTAVEAVAEMEEMANAYNADGVVDVRVIMQSSGAAGGRIRFCAYGTAVVLDPV